MLSVFISEARGVFAQRSAAGLGGERLLAQLCSLKCLNRLSMPKGSKPT